MFLAIRFHRARGPRAGYARRPAWGLLAAVFLAALLAWPSAGAAQPVIVDDFTTNQAALTLTFPPAGTTASSSVAGSMLGGERDNVINLTAGVIAGNQMTAVVSSGFFSYSQDATIAGNGEIQWDGTDTSATLNPTGLGGIDLTVSGSQDALLLNVAFDDLPVNVVLRVYTDGANASEVTLALPGLILAATNFVVPYSAFAPFLGAGADFTDVGAVTLMIGSAITAPDVVLDFLQTTSTLTASKTGMILNDVNGNGQADPGDSIKYTIVITNPDDAFDASATGVTFTNAAPANTDLSVGSVTTSQGTVTTGNTAGDTSVEVDIGTILDGGAVTVMFTVVIDNPIPAGVTQILCQGLVTSDTLPGGVLTDDPTLPGTEDPTVTPLTGAAPEVTATKVGALVVDANGNGVVNPGDTIEYTIVITNCGNQDASGVVFTNNAPVNTTLVVGSVTTTAGTVTTGNTAGDTSVAVNVGTVAGGCSTVTITFRVTVNNPLPPGVTQITCQGTVTGTNIPPILTNDPGTPDPNDPTVIPVQGEPPPNPIPTLDEWGMLLLCLLLTGFGVMRLRRGRASV